MKSKTTALVLSILLGELGIDRFYLGYTGIGILKLLTAGCFGILWLIDIIRIATGELLPADGSSYVNTTEGVSGPASSPYDDLEKLAKLKEQGALTADEYNKLRSSIVEKL